MNQIKNKSINQIKIKMIKCLLHATIWMNLSETVMSKIKSEKRLHMNPFI